MGCDIYYLRKYEDYTVSIHAPTWDATQGADNCYP